VNNRCATARASRQLSVLHIGKYFPPFAGGIEYFLSDLLKIQRAQGIAAVALVHYERPTLRGVSPKPFDPLPVYRAPCLGRLLYIPLSPAFPLWLNRAIRELSPSLLHLHLPNSSALAALASPRARRLPWVVHWHADVVASDIDRRLALAYRLYRPLEQRLLRHADAVIATSPLYLEASSALAPWRSRCTFIPLGLDPHRLVAPPPTLADRITQLWGDTALRVLAIGRLTYYKGHEILIKAIAAIADARALIVGRGEYHQQLLRLIQSLGLEARVQLLGFRSESDVAGLLASCDLLCLPSLERTEAFGLVLLEAMRFAKPVVASAIPGSGVPWVVRRAGNGVLTPPGDAEALAAALRTLQQDRDRGIQLGRAGRDALDREFDIGTVADSITRIYEAVLRNHQMSAK